MFFDLEFRLGYRSSLWILYYIQLIFVLVLWIGYWLRTFQTTIVSNFRMISFSVACLFIVLLAELISSTGLYSDQTYFLLVAIEETVEMLLASSLILLGFRVANLKKLRLGE